LCEAEQWIANWANSNAVPKIKYESLEILALHRIIDIGYLLLDDGQRDDSRLGHVTDLPISHGATLTARERLFKDIFPEKDGLGNLSEFLNLIKTSVLKYIRVDPPIGRGESAPVGPHFVALANSAMTHRETAGSAHVMFNVEMTASLLHYILLEVWPYYYSNILSFKLL
jgi:hypothetical protein